MTHFNRAVIECKKNIDYYAWYAVMKTQFEFDDVKQEILLRMWKASKKYDPSVSQIRTFFINVIKNETLRLMKTNRNNKNRRLESNISLFHEIANHSDEGLEKNTQIIDLLGDKNNFEEKIESKNILDKIENKIEDKKAKRIFIMMRYENLKLKEIARKMKTSKQNVCMIVKRKIRSVVNEIEN